MNYWLLKTEPDHYSFADLERDGATVWDGINNAQALINLRAMQPNDLAFIYHTGKERAVVGIVRVTSAAYPDPELDDPKRVVVDVEALQSLDQPVTLARIKAEPSLSDWTLVRQGRLSVVPCSAEQWNTVLRLAQATE